MDENNEKILTIDVSSKFIKVALISTELKLITTLKKKLVVNSEDIDGFAKNIDMNDLWVKIQEMISIILKNHQNVIGISSCAQRIASVFVDKKGEVLYGGPNTDIRGIDSAFLIEDEFSEEDLFEITGHNPSILFSLSRLLWFKEEEEALYRKIAKILMLDDWLVYKLTGIYCSDPSSAAESQLLDVKKVQWSREIIDAFDFDSDMFPQLVDSGTIVGNLVPNLRDKFNINHKEIPIIKSGGDTQASLLGMGVIDSNSIGITLGTTAPIQLVVERPLIDPNHNYWTSCHSIKGKWLIEAHAGNTGTVYDWFIDGFLSEISNDPYALMDTYLKETIKGEFSTFAFLGPEHMNIKNQTSIKRGSFVFQPPSLISEEYPTIKNFARSVVENIAFGILENHQSLVKIQPTNKKTYCAGGMANSTEFNSILANVLHNDILIPSIKDSSFIGAAMNSLIALNKFQDYGKIIDELINYNVYKYDSEISNSYARIYHEWKNMKSKIDNL